MGKWIGGNKPEDADEWTGFIDQGVKVEGTLDISGTFRVDGNIKGKVRCKDKLIIGEKAHIEGEIEGAVVLVAGKITGTIRCSDRVEVSPTGLIEGEVHTPTLVIEAGGVVEGNCHMRSEPKSAPAKPEPRLTPQPQS